MIRAPDPIGPDRFDEGDVEEDVPLDLVCAPHTYVGAGAVPEFYYRRDSYCCSAKDRWTIQARSISEVEAPSLAVPLR